MRPPDILINQQQSGESPISIQLGDQVHHPQHGVGKVQSIRETSFSGAAEATYAKLYFKRDSLTLTVLHQDLETSVRRLITSKEARRLLQEMPSWECKASKQWKTRADASQAAIDGGNPFEYAKVYKSLSELDAEGALRPRDRAHLNQSLDFLTEEIALSLGKTKDQARKMISKSLG